MLTLLVAGSATAAVVYRYEDADGRIVFDSRIPPEYVKNGYTIMENGRVREVVPPAPSEEELAALEAQREQQQISEAERARQQEADNLLLRLYRAPEEIVRRRDEKLRQLQAQIIALNASLSKADEEVARLEAAVENGRNADGEAQPEQLSQLQDGIDARDRVQIQIDRLEAESDRTVANAEQEINRLVELLGLENWQENQ